MAGFRHDTCSSGKEAHGKFKLFWIDVLFIQPLFTFASVAIVIDPKHRLFRLIISSGFEQIRRSLKTHPAPPPHKTTPKAYKCKFSLIDKYCADSASGALQGPREVL
jgi:hypothetical protein